jgi:hypothetical protein
MVLLAALVYYLFPAAVGLAVVAYIYARWASDSLAHRVAGALACGFVAAPVLTNDGYGAGIVPLWLYAVLRAASHDLASANAVTIMAAWAIVASISLVAIWWLGRTASRKRWD